MQKKIVAGMFLVLAIALALGFALLYPGALEAAEKECEGGVGEAISPNETGYEDVALIKAENKSREIAEEYLLNSPTFRFDGIEDSLKLVDMNVLDCPDCWEFVFEFQCRHAGYGNRAGQMLAQVITPHTAKIVIEQGRVTSAIMDEKWDMLEQKMIDNKPIISVSSTVFEGERGMDIFDDGNVTCYSDHYYPGYKEIVRKEGYISKAEIDALLELFSNLSEYSYTINASEQLTSDHMNCIFDPVGGGTSISCIPLNKTLSIRLTLFPGTETATPTAREIVKRIDKIFREAEVTGRRKEINPSCISLNLEPYAPSYQPNQMITFNASLRLIPELERTLYEWDFGDGSKKGYGKIIRHSYSSPGNYTIRLKIISEDVVVGIKDKTIAISSTPAPVIWIEKKVKPEIEHGAATTGGKVTITIEIENRRDKEIFDADVRDEFPEGKFKLVSGDTSMYLRALKPGESKILKYELRALEAGYSVLKPATITYKDESGVQYSNKSNTAEVMVRVPPPGLLIPEFIALFVIVGPLAAVVVAYLVLRRLK